MTKKPSESKLRKEDILSGAANYIKALMAFMLYACAVQTLHLILIFILCMYFMNNNKLLCAMIMINMNCK